MYISTLKVVIILSPQCSSIPPLYHLIKQTDPSQPSKLMILGTTCSVSSIIMGEIAQRSLNLTQVRLCIVMFFCFCLCHVMILIKQRSIIASLQNTWNIVACRSCILLNLNTKVQLLATYVGIIVFNLYNYCKHYLLKCPCIVNATGIYFGVAYIGTYLEKHYWLYFSSEINFGKANIWPKV